MKGNCIPLLLSDEGGQGGERGREGRKGREREGGGKRREEGREVGGVKCKCEISVARRHAVDKQEV